MVSKPARAPKRRTTNAASQQPQTALQSFFLNAATTITSHAPSNYSCAKDSGMQQRNSISIADDGEISVSSQECIEILDAIASESPEESAFTNDDEMNSAKRQRTHESQHTTSADAAVLMCPVCNLPQNTDMSAFEAHVNTCLDTQAVSVDAAATNLETDMQYAVVKHEIDDVAAESVVSETVQGNHAADPDESMPIPADPVSKQKRLLSRTCPFYKWIPNTSFTVDAFSYGAIPNCSAYFLTHFHSDHYGGLVKSFNHGPIYCSSVTANLVSEQIGVDSKYLVSLPMETPIQIQGVEVTLMDANHCPGAVMFLFEIPKHAVDGDAATFSWTRHLHTGDFRACPDHVSHPCLQERTVKQEGEECKNMKKRRPLMLDTIFLDTTYCRPEYTFPTQDIVINAVCELVRGVAIDGRTVQSMVTNESTSITRFFKRTSPDKSSSASINTNGVFGTLRSWLGTSPSVTPSHSDVLVVVGSYLIGKEKVFMSVARTLGWRIFCTAAKRRIMACLEDAELDKMLIADPLKANVHVVGMQNLNKENLVSMLDEYRPRFTKIIAIRPTGWTFSDRRRSTNLVSPKPVKYSNNASTLPQTPPFNVHSLQPKNLTKDIVLVPIPYSEHSSFNELEMFVRSMRVKQVVPTVGVGNAATRSAMDAWIKHWMQK